MAGVYVLLCLAFRLKLYGYCHRGIIVIHLSQSISHNFLWAQRDSRTKAEPHRVRVRARDESPCEISTRCDFKVQTALETKPTLQRWVMMADPSFSGQKQ